MCMKILYVTNLLFSLEQGVTKKIFSQCKALESFNNVVDLISIKDNSLKFINFNEFEQTVCSRSSSCFARIIRGIKTIVSTIDFVPLEKNTYDLIYVRHLLPVLPAYIAFMKKIKENTGAYMYYELPTYPYRQEFRHLSLPSIYTMLFEYRSVERIGKIANEFVLVNEVTEERAKNRLTKYCIIPNGFDVSSVSLRNTPQLKNEIHILGLANLAFWHGYDRVITGIAGYNGPYKIIFHLAGGSGKKEIEILKKLTVDLRVSDNVKFYPPLHNNGLDKLFNCCHVAAGSLGLHRINAQNGSILKLREYCSRGIPFFYAYNDSDFNDCDFSLKIPANDDPVDINKICTFVEKMYQVRNLTLKMRTYAIKYLSWNAKMKLLFNKTKVAKN